MLNKPALLKKFAKWLEAKGYFIGTTEADRDCLIELFFSEGN